MARKNQRLTLDQRARLRISETNPGMPHITLDRRQVCLTELDSAAHLFFYRDDLVSAHVLASAALEIMTALSGKDNGIGINHLRDFLKDQNIAKSEMDEIFDGLNHPYNFSKHSSSDATVENDYPIEFMIMTLWTAVHTFKKLFGDMTFTMSLFYGMIMAWKIEWWEGTPGQEERAELANKFALAGKSRADVRALGQRLLAFDPNRSGSSPASGGGPAERAGV